MPQILSYDKYEVVAGGGTKNFASDTSTQAYIVWSGGGVALVGNVTISDDGSSVEGMAYPVLMTGGVTLNGQTLTIFGYSLSESQASNGCKLLAYFDGSSFITYVDANANGTGQITTNDIADEAVTLAKMADLARGSIIVGGASNRPVALDARGSGKILIGDATDLNSVSQTGDGTFGNTGVFAITAGAIVNADINASAAIAYSKMATIATGSYLGGTAGTPTVLAMSGDVTLSATGVATIANSSVTPSKSTSGLTDTEATVAVSFETTLEDAIVAIRMPCNFTIISTSAKLLDASTGNATIDFSIAGTPVTGGTVSFAAAATQNTSANGTAVTANNTGTTGQDIQLITTTDAVGGAAEVTVIYRRTN